MVAEVVGFGHNDVARLLFPVDSLGLSSNHAYRIHRQNDLSRVEIRRAENGVLDGVQLHVLSYLGEQWGMGEPRFTTEQAVAFTETMRSAGAAMTWDIPVQKNGLMSKSFLDQLTALGASATRLVSVESTTSSSPATGRHCG
jgi:hypothetical protein